jgi:plasmid maintenance system antidote protein VapI
MDYRELIKAEFLKRREIDPFYSMRSYAKDLGLKPTHLSYLLRGKRGLSKAKAWRVGSELNLKQHAGETFRFMVSAQSGRSVYERNLAKQGLKRKHLVLAAHRLEQRLKK